MEEAFYFVIEETELFYNFMSKSDQSKVTYFPHLRDLDILFCALFGLTF